MVVRGLANAVGDIGQTEHAGGDMPWDEEELAKHKGAKEAPSALNAVVVPKMTLPAVRFQPACNWPGLGANKYVLGCP